MKIVYFAPTELPNRKSHSVQILQTAHALARLGNQVEVIATKMRGSEADVLAAYGLDPHPNFELRRFSRRFRKFNKWHSRRFRLLLFAKMLRDRAGERETVYYTRGTERVLQLIGSMAPLAKFLGIPIVYELHAIQYLDLSDEHRGRYGEGDALEKYIQKRHRLETGAYRRLRGIISISSVLDNLIREHFNYQGPILRARSALKIPEESPPALEGREWDISFVGGLYEFNGVDILVKAMTDLPGRQLHILGGGEEGDEERIRNSIRLAGVEDRVHLLGFRPHAEALAAMRQSKVLVAPLLRTGRVDRASWSSPGKIFEYMAAGAAIVASRIDCLQEVLQDEENAFLVEPNSAEALARGIRKALEEKELAQSVADQAVKEAQDYTFDKRAAKIDEFLKSFF